MKRQRLDGALAAVRRSERPQLHSNDAELLALAEAALIAPYHAAAAADLLLLVEGELPPPAPAPPTLALSRGACRQLLEECLHDGECRMDLAGRAAAAALAASASVFDLAGRLADECFAVGLARRHAARLAVEGVLSAHAAEARAKATAAALERSVRAADVAQLLACLEAARLGACALNVLSVLVFLRVLPEAAVVEWGGAGGGGAPAWAAPLLEWIAREEEEEEKGGRGEEGEEEGGGGGEGEEEEARVGGEGGGGGGRSGGRGEGEEEEVVGGGEGEGEEEVRGGREGEASRGAPGGASASAAGRAEGAPLWREVKTHESDWDPAAAPPVLNAQLGCGDAIVVLDHLVDEGAPRSEQRAELLAHLIGAEPPGPAPPRRRWERTTCDGAGLPASWGVQPRVLQALEDEPPRAVLEVQSRLRRLYPEYTVAHMPSCPFAPRAEGEAQAAGRFHCTSFVANAAVYGNCFQWHVDADPSSLPPCRWLDRFGDYLNGTRGKPLFVSLIVYLDSEWRSDWDAETLFLEQSKGVGFFVQPRPGRAVLMHQDVFHRLSTPSMLARRPRYSLVWKLLFIPQHDASLREGDDNEGRPETICRQEWGPPLIIGDVQAINKPSLGK
ncbi:hypothetical protein AB1Y20_006081 [Prymnesium parvum]|uniref:Fe2OG dioxygenase domain-containing protein n=1 Tax=Prymnesium parvum TaxID=97485 RepID=A0AB34J0Q8_PRYPA